MAKDNISIEINVDIIGIESNVNTLEINISIIDVIDMSVLDKNDIDKIYFDAKKQFQLSINIEDQCINKKNKIIDKNSSRDNSSIQKIDIILRRNFFLKNH